MQQDMRLQLIIEAFNRTQSAWNELTVQTEKAKAEVVGLNAGAASTGNALDAAGTKGAAAMRHMSLSAQESAERMKRVGLSVAAFRDYVASAQAELPALQSRVAALKTPLDAVNTGATAAGTALEETGKKGGAGMKHVHDQAHQAHSMLGQMVQMALVMGALMGSKKLFEWGMEYNKTLETSRLGLSAIITSMGEVTDSQGRVLQGQEKWNASTQISVEAQRELQKIGMTTAATYTELVEVYQGILAPALSAKMTFKETLDITGLLTNSVKALGLPINQIKQEARDLIQGGIQPASSSLAIALGISDAMVKKWREQGTVYKELKGRLEGFVYASKEFSDTWEGAWSNFRDVAQRALGEGSKPLFDFIRNEVIKLTNDMTIITRDAAGNILDIQIKPEVVARIRELAEDLKQLVEIIGKGVTWGSKLAEPAIWLGVAVGINKITTAVKGLAIAANAGGLTRLISSLPALAAVTGIYLGKKYAEGVDLNREAGDIRSQVFSGHDAAKMKASGLDAGSFNLDEFGGQQLEYVRKMIPTADNKQIAAMLRDGVISMKKYHDAAFNEYFYKVNIDDDRAKKFMEGGQTPFGLKGPDKESDEAKKKRLADARAAAKKADQDAIAEAELQQRQAFGVIDQVREEDHEANKEWLRQRKLLHEEEKIDEAAWIESQRQFKLAEATIDDTAIGKKIDALNAEWTAKRGHYAEGKALDTAYAAYSLQFDKLTLDATKATNAELIANDEARLATLKLKKKTAAEAAKEAADLAKAQRAAANSDAAARLSQVELDEQAGILSTVEALGKKVAILKELEEQQQRELTGMGRNSAEEITAWNSQAQAIEQTRQKLNRFQTELSERNPLEGMRRALRAYADDAGNTGAQVGNAFTSAFKGMEDALVRFAQTGKLNFSDMADSIIADLIRIQIRAAITGPLSGALSSGLAAMMGGGTIDGYNPNTIYAGDSPGPWVQKHDGGMIVPRFHFGGLASDEVPAVLLTKERVLSREQNVLFEKFVNKTEGGGGAPVINIINNAADKVETKPAAPRFDGQQWVVDMVIQKLRSDPGTRAAFAGGGNF